VLAKGFTGDVDFMGRPGVHVTHVDVFKHFKVVRVGEDATDVAVTTRVARVYVKEDVTGEVGCMVRLGEVVVQTTTVFLTGGAKFYDLDRPVSNGEGSGKVKAANALR